MISQHVLIYNRCMTTNPVLHEGVHSKIPTTYNFLLLSFLFYFYHFGTAGITYWHSKVFTLFFCCLFWKYFFGVLFNVYWRKNFKLKIFYFFRFELKIKIRHGNGYGCSFVAKPSWKKFFFFEKIFVLFTKYTLFVEEKCFYMRKTFYNENFFYWKKLFFTEKNIN